MPTSVTTGGPALVVVSNRGPLNFALDDGRLVTKKAAGGLVNTLVPALTDRDAIWVAGAIGDADRRAAEGGPIQSDGIDVRLLAIAEDDYRAYYDDIANSTLWYLHHGMFDLPRRPLFDQAWRASWDRFRRVNEQFSAAAAAAAPEGATVVVHDYHLSLVGASLAAARPDLHLVHFNHTPFCTAEELRVLPDDVAVELMAGLTGFASCGFHTERWAENFADSAESVLGRRPETFVAPAAPDLADVEAVADSRACAEHLAEIEALVGDRLFIARVDRIELSKNLVRGFLAFDELLDTRPEWRGKVVFGASVYPSRQGLADYLEYTREVHAVIQAINDKWATESWTPILVDADDNFPASVAVLKRYDVLVVNPVRDGLNLVAKEGAVVNDRNGVLVLSRESGVHDELGSWAIECNPFDVGATATALHTALCMSTDERARRADGMRAAVRSRSPHDWLADQLHAGG